MFFLENVFEKTRYRFFSSDCIRNEQKCNVKYFVGIFIGYSAIYTLLILLTASINELRSAFTSVAQKSYSRLCCCVKRLEDGDEGTGTVPEINDDDISTRLQLDNNISSVNNSISTSSYIQSLFLFFQIA